MSSTTENRFVRLKGQYERRNGDAYLEYELRVDAPEVPATRGDANPPHAIAGDVLREDEDRDWQLRRDGQRIGDPEAWQVRHLFEGISREASSAAAGRSPLLFYTTLIFESGKRLKGWEFERAPDHQPRNGDMPEIQSGGCLVQHPGGGWQLYPEIPGSGYPVDTATAEGFLTLNRLESDARYDRPRRLVSGLNHRGAAHLEANVGDLRVGDILVHGEPRPEIGGAVVGLTMDHYEALRCLVDDGQEVVTDLFPFRFNSVGAFLGDRRKWGRGLKVWRPRLWRVRCPVEVVSEPIQAASDDVALFELLYSVGGRMPHA